MTSRRILVRQQAEDEIDKIARHIAKQILDGTGEHSRIAQRGKRCSRLQARTIATDENR